ncbi:MAG: MliC family protein [Rickettsiales bacterium]|nr:MliC family protein [Rickettsiales bacterium]
MYKIILSLLFAAPMLIACSADENAIKCGGHNVKIQVAEDAITANINGITVNLPQVVSASGAKYQGDLNGDTVVLWSKGSDWIMYINDGDALNCKK